MAIKGNSGLGKTTLMVITLHSLSKSRDEEIEPFFHKAGTSRKSDYLEILASICLKKLTHIANDGLHLVKKPDCDGIDENTKLMNKLLDRLDKSSNFYHADIL